MVFVWFTFIFICVEIIAKDFNVMRLLYFFKQWNNIYYFFAVLEFYSQFWNFHILKYFFTLYLID